MPAESEGLLSYRNRQGVCYRPSVSVNSHLDGLSFNSNSHSPVANGQSHAVMAQEAIRAGVSGLVANGLPFHVAGNIMPVVVNSPKRVLRSRRITNVSQETFKRLSPPLADCDTPAPVPRVVIHRWVSTSPNHASPRTILLRLAVTILCRAVVSVSREAFPGRCCGTLPLKTAATTRRPGFGCECMSPDRLYRSAGTLAQKPRTDSSVPLFGGRRADNCQTAKFLSDRDLSWVHVYIVV